MKQLLFAALFLPLLAFADQQQPFDSTSLGFHVGYLNGHVAPEADIAVKLGNPVAGFQTFSVTGFAVLSATQAPVKLQATAVTGVALVRPLGEYVYYGPITQLGIGNDGTNTGMVGKAGGVAGYRFGHSQHWAAEAIVTVTRSPLGSYTPEGAIGVRFGFNAGLSGPPITQFKAPKPKKFKAPRAPKA